MNELFGLLIWLVALVIMGALWILSAAAVYLYFIAAVEDEYLLTGACYVVAFGSGAVAVWLWRLMTGKV